MGDKSAVVLLSGGIDSAVTAAVALRDGYELHAMTFRYGQRHEIEERCASRLASFFGAARHMTIEIPAGIFRSALMIGSGIEVPRDRDPVREETIPETYVPARNILFLSYALAYAESAGAGAVFIGANAVDYSGYPDCRPEFFERFQEMADIGTRAGVLGKGVRIVTPVIKLKKSEIIALGITLGVDFSLTHSCYDPGRDGAACGRCDSCLIRKKGFAGAGVPDPTRYGGR